MAALTLAWRLDSNRQSKATISELALAAEKTKHPPVLGTFQVALSNLPWSLAWVDTFVRARRAYASGQKEVGAPMDRLNTLLIVLRDWIDRTFGGPRRMPVGGLHRIQVTLLAKLRKPRVVLSLVMISPFVLRFGIAGFPATAWVERALTTAPAWAVIRLLSTVTLGWTGWNVIRRLCRWPRIARWQLADFPATVALELLSGAGAFVIGSYALFVSASNASPFAPLIRNTHISSTNPTSEAALLLSLMGSMLSGIFGAPSVAQNGGEGGAGPSTSGPEGAGPVQSRAERAGDEFDEYGLKIPEKSFLEQVNDSFGEPWPDEGPAGQILRGFAAIPASFFAYFLDELTGHGMILGNMKESTENERYYQERKEAQQANDDIEEQEHELEEWKRTHPEGRPDGTCTDSDDE